MTFLNRDVLSRLFNGDPRAIGAFEELDQYLSDKAAEVAALLTAAEDATARLTGLESADNQAHSTLLDAIARLPDDAGAVEFVGPDDAVIRGIDTTDSASLISRGQADLRYAAIAGSATPQSLTFSSAGVGAAPGSTFNGGTPVTISYNSVGAAASVHTHASGDITGLGYFATGTDAANLTGTVAAGRMPALTGDVTTSAGAVATTIAAGVVTPAKMANVATGTLFYRKTAGTGAPEVQTLATLKADLGLTGTNSGDQTITLTGDVTGSGTGSFAATIAANAVTNAKLAQVATATFKGRRTAGTGNVEDLTVAQAKTLLAITAADVSGLAAVATSGSASDLSTGTVAAARQSEFGGLLKISGMTFGLNPVSNTTTLAGVADRHQLIPWTPEADVTITAIGVECQTAVASANAKVVVYDTSATTRGPNNLLKETTNLDCSTTGYKSVAWAFTFLRGVTYWVGVRTSSTATLRGTAAAGMLNIGRQASTGTGNANVVQKTLTFATAAADPYGAVPLGQLQANQAVYDVIATQA